VWHNKDPSCSKALSAEHRPKFAALSPVKVTTARLLKNCSCGYKQINKQTRNILELTSRKVSGIQRIPFVAEMSSQIKPKLVKPVTNCIRFFSLYRVVNAEGKVGKCLTVKGTMGWFLVGFFFGGGIKY
jgi:hypothetical protein